MSNFMAFDQQKAQELTDRLSKTMFKSPSDFVGFYNSGLINKSHPDVSTIVNELVENYRDIEERNKKLIFISKHEVYLDDLSRVIAVWSVITKIRRELGGLIEDNKVSPADEIGFLASSPGLIAVRNGTDESFDVVGSEKMVSRHADVADLFTKYSSTNDSTKEYFSFMVTDFTSLDDSFIEKMMEAAPKV